MAAGYPAAFFLVRAAHAAAMIGSIFHTVFACGPFRAR
jgi:hypothetical protein